MKKRDETHVIMLVVLYLVFGIINIISIFWAPISGGLIDLIRDKTMIVFILVIPEVITLGVFILAFAWETMKKESLNDVPPSGYMKLLVYFSLIIVLFTGGIAKSPLSPEVVIIPLICGPFYEAKDRLGILLANIIGVSILSALSFLPFFQPPETYPQMIESGISIWKGTGQYDTWIVAFVLVVGLLYEMFVIKMPEWIKEYKESSLKHVNAV